MTKLSSVENTVREFEELYGDFFDQYFCCAGYDCNCSGTEVLPNVMKYLTTTLTNRDNEIIALVGALKPGFENTVTGEVSYDAGVLEYEARIIKALKEQSKI